MIAWHLKKYNYRAHKISPLAPNLIQTNPVRTFPFYSFKNNFDIILSSTSWSSKLSPPFKTSDHNLHFSFLYVAHPTNSDTI
jgi:hypothetical protein